MVSFHVSLVVRKPVFGVSDQVRHFTLKIARALISVEGLYCLCSENKGADQLCGYRTADLRLCFRIAKAGFLMKLLM